MSTVFVHVGQAGCQLGQTLWPSLACERLGSPDIFGSSRTRRTAACPRAVLVDSEPKVVDSLIAGADAGGFSFDPGSVAISQNGRGGNFALGYSGEDLRDALSSGQQPLFARAMECMRRQVEGCHGRHLGSMLTHSLGGGTGSGLGTRIVEEIRDAYPRSSLLVASILPISTGENPMQCYNVLLALAALQELSDGILLYENDWLLSSAEGRTAQSITSSSVASGEEEQKPWLRGTSLESMNNVVARGLVPLLCPALDAAPLDLGDLLAGVVPMATHKFMQTFSAEVSGPHGPPCGIKPVFDALARATPKTQRCASGNVIAAYGTVRGMPNNVLGSGTKTLQSDLLERLGGAVPWQPFAGELRCSHVPLRQAPASARISVVANWKRTAQVLEAISLRARQKYASRMFLQWYDHYNFGPETFAQAFEVVDEVIANYDAS